MTDCNVCIESREPFEIPLYMIEDCHVFITLPSLGAEISVVSGSTVTLKYLAESGHRRKVEFEMNTCEAGALEKLMKSFYQHGITR